MSLLEQIRALKRNQNNVSEEVNTISDKMEELIGPAEMWNTLRPGFDLSEFIENLEYIAREHDL